MSDDLISRKFLLECAEYDDKWRLVIPYEKVKNAPTAFDKEKVLEKLGAEKNGKLDYCIEFAGANTIAKAEFRAFDDAIRIVEKGGIE